MEAEGPGKEDSPQEVHGNCKQGSRTRREDGVEEGGGVRGRDVCTWAGGGGCGSGSPKLQGEVWLQVGTSYLPRSEAESALLKDGSCAGLVLHSYLWQGQGGGVAIAAWRAQRIWRGGKPGTELCPSTDGRRHTQRGEQLCTAVTAGTKREGTYHHKVPRGGAAAPFIEGHTCQRRDPIRAATHGSNTQKLGSGTGGRSRMGGARRKQAQGGRAAGVMNEAVW